MRERRGLTAPVPEAEGPPATPTGDRRAVLDGGVPEEQAAGLVLVAGDRSWPLTGLRLLLGRRDGGVGADIELDDASVSRRHAEVVRIATGLLLRDLGSSNGTSVDGVRLGVGVDTPLRDGQRLMFGTVAALVAAQPSTHFAGRS